MVNNIQVYITAIILLQYLPPLKSQDISYPFEIEKYSFVRYDSNRIQYPAKKTCLDNVWEKLDHLLLCGEGQLKIVHIGGSHIQADIYTHRIRTRLQTFYPGIKGSRGYVFPYTIAGTNNPRNYHVLYSGKWDYCKNTNRKRKCDLGLAGIHVSTKDTTASVHIKLNNDSIQPYVYNRVKIFHDVNDSTCFTIHTSADKHIEHIDINHELGYSEYFLNTEKKEFAIFFTRDQEYQEYFRLYGFSFENDDPGIIYNSFGINGAMLSSYLRCNLFDEHLEALYPDLIIISIGTNDAYTRNFNKELYRSRYDSLIQIIRNAVPEASILLTVPNDSYIYKRYLNHNTQDVKKIIFDLAKENNCAVWDFYTVMGGLNSAYTWYMQRLMRYDKLHFTRKGYIYKGDLFFNAFLKAWEEGIEVRSQ